MKPKSKPHILLAALQTGKSSNGGMESAVSLVEAMRDDFAWSVVTTHESGFTARLRNAGAQILLVRGVSGGNRIMRGIQQFQLGRAIQRIIRSVKPDIVHANDIRMLRAATASSHGAPLLFSLRDLKQDDVPYGSEWRAAIANTTGVVTLSRNMATCFAARIGLAHPPEFHTIHSLVNLNLLTPASGAGRIQSRVELQIDAGEFAIGVIGAVMPKKQQLALIRQAVPTLAADMPQAHLHFLGDFDPAQSPYAHACAEQVKHNSLSERVTFHGHQADMPGWLKALDLVLIASEREGLARAMIEAMASGIPVVSFDVCSAKEMLQDTGAGVVVPIGDYDALIGAVKDISTNAAKAQAMGAAGRAAAERLFSEQSIRSQWLDLYRQCAQSAPDMEQA